MAPRLLIVDDHAPFRATARALLEAEGFEVVGEAENGVQALRAVKELQPDVVLLDINLPDFDGFEVASRLGDGDSPVVVLISSRDAADYARLVKKSSARGFLKKDELSGAALARLIS